MNREELKEIILNNNIINKQGHRINNKTLQYKYYFLYDFIYKYTLFLDDNVKLTERIYCIINDIIEEPLCYCGKKVWFNRFTKGYVKTCSQKCAANSIEVKTRKKETIKEKLENDPEYYKKISDKIKNTYKEKTGYNHQMNNPEIREKIKQTCNDRYNCDNPFKSEEIRNKYYNNIINKYGSIENFKKIKREIYNKSIKDKYNVKHIMELSEIKDKIYNKNLFNFLNKMNLFLIENNLELISVYTNAHDKLKFKCTICNTEFETSWNYIQQGIKCPSCFKINYNISSYEYEIKEFLESLNLKLILNSREIISPYEIDIFIPDKNIGIEFNGLYFHNDNFVDKNYHINKLELSIKKNIKLIQIFEDEYLYKKEIVKERLKHILNIPDIHKIRIHARKCEIKEIDSKIKNEFLNKYHIQGKDNSIIKLGAFYNDELISIMTFSKGNISKGSKSIDGIYELNRFCSNYNYHIPGIASKLLKYFEKNYNWNQIFSYADRRWSDGNLYYNLGFKFDKFTKINYWYTKNKLRIHRYNLRKSINNPNNLPEKIIREQQGYFIIWDCGNIKFTKFNNN